MAFSVLVVDFDRHATEQLRSLLEQEGATPRAIFHPDELARLELAGRFDLIMLASDFPTIEGKAPGAYIQIKAPGQKMVALLAADADPHPEEAETPILRKPYQPEELRPLLSPSFPADDTFFGMVGRSRAMRHLFDTLRNVAKTEAPILIEGETGVGKELVARAIHKLSRRRFRRMTTLNCGSLSETLLASELFGHEKGAFTGAFKTTRGAFEQAHGGTLFLDEIGEITPAAQVTLLKVLETGEVTPLGSSRVITTDLRLLFATNRHLDEEVAAGRFRRDLYYRINVFPITIPPLRERPEDIPLLVNYFADRAAKIHERRRPSIADATYAALSRHPWPGNVRELAGVMERAIITTRGEPLSPADVGLQESPEPLQPAELAAMDYRLFRKQILTRAERDYFTALLSVTGGNVSKAAKKAGLDRKTFYAKMDACGVDVTTLRQKEKK